jgi:hypothetical protein
MLQIHRPQRSIDIASNNYCAKGHQVKKTSRSVQSSFNWLAKIIALQLINTASEETASAARELRKNGQVPSFTLFPVQAMTEDSTHACLFLSMRQDPLTGHTTAMEVSLYKASLIKGQMMEVGSPCISLRLRMVSEALAANEISVVIII